MSTRLGDFPILKVNGIDLERLTIAMGLAQDFPSCGYAIDEELGRLIFFRYPDHTEMVPFPSKMSAERCAQIAMDWLEQVRYPNQPDHDGSNKKGWLVQVDEPHPYGFSAFLTVEPHWLCYGK